MENENVKKKKGKKILIIVGVIVALLILLATCSGGSSDDGGVSSKLTEKFETLSNESAYADLYAFYQEFNEYESKNGKSEASTEMRQELTEMLLLGYWKSGDTMLSFNATYTDYDNTKSSTWFSTNLENSKTFGNTYYYYVDATDTGAEIGYKEKITEEKTPNYMITFNESSLTLNNLINSQTYEMTLDESVAKVTKGAAKLAYVAIAKNILSMFKIPSSAKVLSCKSDVNSDVVYAKISAQNALGGTLEYTYKFYKIGESYFYMQTTESFSSNIDIDELNSRLKTYIKNNQ